MIKIITVTADGASTNDIIPDEATTDGDCLIVATAGTWAGTTSLALEGSLTPTVSTSWFPVKDSSGVAVTFGSNGAVLVVSGIYYRVTTTNYAGSATVKLTLKSS